MVDVTVKDNVYIRYVQNFVPEKRGSVKRGQVSCLSLTLEAARSLVLRCSVQHDMVVARSAALCTMHDDARGMTQA